MAKGYILEASEKWVEASEHFTKVYEALGDEDKEGLRAEEERAWCISKTGHTTPGLDALRIVLRKLDGSDHHDHDRARCYWRLGKCLWDLGSKSHCAFS